jgi:hypothetical protein
VLSSQYGKTWSLVTLQNTLMAAQLFYPKSAFKDASHLLQPGRDQVLRWL